MRGLDIYSKSSHLHQRCRRQPSGSPGRSAGVVCSISERLWRWVWVGSSSPGRFSSTFVLVWFVEHVVYGEGLYFLEFDELQMKEDQMNGHVTEGRGGGGYTLCRAVSVNLSMHTLTHPEP